MEDIQNLSTILYENFYRSQIYLPYLFHSSVSMLFELIFPLLSAQSRMIYHSNSLPIS